MTSLNVAALQLAFGWSDCHLNRFRIHGKDSACTM